VRSKTIAVATAIPYLINPDQANLGGKLGVFFGGLSIPCLLWWYLRVPEMKGRTYEELDIMFERNVKTRQFKGYQI
jgi:SP family general alpha glucoside:H+ symporter-like MFS transporter